MRILAIASTSIAMLALASGCASEGQGVYRGGQQVLAAPLDLKDHYSFRFVEKWRISHNWLSGPVELRGCKGYGSNSFRRLGGYGALGLENMEPMIENSGIIYSVYEHKSAFRIVSPRERIYGTDRDGKFTGFIPFCVHFFRDSMDGLGLYIVKPDSAKGTDEWIKGAKSVTINGLNWLHKEEPLRDWSQNREQQAGPIEYWVLRIPETPYWLYLSFSASSGVGSKYGSGASAHPEKHQRLLDLFHGIVASVKLEPIEPINLDRFNLQEMK